MLVPHSHLLVVVPGTWDGVVSSNGRSGWSNSSLANPTSCILAGCATLVLTMELCQHVALAPRLCLHVAAGYVTSSPVSSDEVGIYRASVASLLGSFEGGAPCAQLALALTLALRCYWRSLYSLRSTCSSAGTHARTGAGAGALLALVLTLMLALALVLALALLMALTPRCSWRSTHAGTGASASAGALLALMLTLMLVLALVLALALLMALTPRCSWCSAHASAGALTGAPLALGLHLCRQSRSAHAGTDANADARVCVTLGARTAPGAHAALLLA